MKYLLLPLAFCLCSFVTAGAQDVPPVMLANPFQGTDSNANFSHGNMFPTIALPFPMNTWAPYTEPKNEAAFYQYKDTKFYGIRQSHEPSIWIRDHANYALMPISGPVVTKEDDRASDFKHESEVAQPSYYKVYLDTWKVTAEVTPTERAARLRFTFDQQADSSIILDVFKSEKPCSVEIIPSENKIIGITRNNSGAVPNNFGNYFVIVFDKPFKAYGVYSDDVVQDNVTKIEGNHIGVYVKFDTSSDKVVQCKTASSFISAEQAALNLQQEIGDADFDTIRQRAEKAWNDYLGRAKIEGGTDEQRRTFYSALYRSILFPHRFYEWDADHKPIHYSPYDGKVHPGVLYTDSGFWDTFRAAHPLYNLLYPDISAEILESVVTSYNESGFLPAWSSPGQRQAMIGNHAFSLLADGWVKGVRSFDLPTAVKGIIHDAHHGGFFGMGRANSEDYESLGFMPYPEVGNATAKTLEYAYDDFCASTLCAAAGDKDAADGFAKSMMNYKNLFDPGTGFMRAKKRDGSWVEPFDPTEWGGPYIEGNAWQWTWSVMQDEPGLVTLMGGDKAYCDKLDAMFNAGSAVNVGSYHTMIHEMSEMVAQNLGQYAHGNEPVHHVIYLYDYAGQPWKTQARIRQVMDLLYQSTPDGLSGDEDTGQMSAWYVLSALGIYPVCPGDPNYLIGSPLFNKATLTFPNGKIFTITAKDNGTQKYYIGSATLNGQNYDRTYIAHDQIANGGDLSFQMKSFPNYKWGVAPDSRPPSPIQGNVGSNR